MKHQSHLLTKYSITMDLSEKEIGCLRYIERWGTYRASDGALSMELVISRNRKYFPSIMREEDTIVKSFNMQNLPQADAMLVFGYPRVVAYAAEIAVRHRDMYGDYPELFAIGDGRGMFSQRQEMDKWIPKQLTDLGFPQKWAFKNSSSHAEKNRAYTADANVLILSCSIRLRRRLKVLVITGAGCSMSAAQELISLMPHTDFFIFETPQPRERIFDSEKFSPKSYGVDALLAQVVRCRLNADKMKLPIEKLLGLPRTGFIQDLLFRGYAGYFVSDEMWKCIGINPVEGAKLHKERIADLQRFIRPRCFEKQTKRLLDEIRKNLTKKALIV